MNVRRLSALALIGFFCLTACESKDIEGDAKKLIELRCQSIALAKKGGDKANLEKIRTLAEQADNLEMTRDEKYTGDDAEKFSEALAKGIRSCI